jgi:hypothetical protein
VTMSPSLIWITVRSIASRLSAALDLDGSRKDHAYLSEAIDVYDLERRMRQVDRRRVIFTNAYLSMASSR